MSSIPIQNVAFDDTATSAMGEAFDKACKSLRNFGTACTVREIMSGLLQSPEMASALPPASMSKH